MQVTYLCARCNQPTEGERIHEECRIRLRELHPDEIDGARAAAIADITRMRDRQRAMQGYGSREERVG